MLTGSRDRDLQATAMTYCVSAQTEHRSKQKATSSTALNASCRVEGEDSQPVTASARISSCCMRICEP